MWFNALLVACSVVITIGILGCCGVLGSSQSEEQNELREQASKGYVFLIEPIDAETFTRCGCLTGLPATYKVSGGWGANGSLCMQCVRSEFARWLLYRVDGATENRVAAVAGKRD